MEVEASKSIFGDILLLKNLSFVGKLFQGADQHAVEKVTYIIANFHPSSQANGISFSPCPPPHSPPPRGSLSLIIYKCVRPFF